MRRAAGIFSISLGAVLIGLALLLLVYNQKEDENAGAVSEEILEQVKEIIEAAEIQAIDRIDPETGLPAEEMKEVTISGEGYIGYLSIPALSLELPVMAEWSYPKLRIAPCREVGNVNTKDLVIAAHNYSRHFGRIKQLVPGDIVMFTDMNRVTTVYQVALTELLEPQEVEEMRSDKWDLTLYTCTYGGKIRIAVRCLEAER